MPGWEQWGHPNEGGDSPQFPLSCKDARDWLRWELRKRKLTKCAGNNSQLDLQHRELVSASGPLFPGTKSVEKLKYPRGAKLTNENDFWRAYCLWYPDAARRESYGANPWRRV
jgi:hypothetical protein